MPSLQELEHFQASFQNVGGEKEIRDARGEPMPTTPLPTDGLDDDLANLLSAGAELDDMEEGLAGGTGIPMDNAFLDTSDYSDSVDIPGSNTLDDAPAIPDEPPTDSFDPDSLNFGAFLDSIPDDLSAPSELAGDEPLSIFGDDALAPTAKEDSAVQDEASLVETDGAGSMDDLASLGDLGNLDSLGDLGDLGDLGSLADSDEPGDLSELGKMEESAVPASFPQGEGGAALVDEDSALLPESPSLTGPNAPDDGFDADEEPADIPDISDDLEGFNLDESMDLFSETPSPAASMAEGSHEGDSEPAEASSEGDFSMPEGEADFSVPEGDFSLPGGDFSMPEDNSTGDIKEETEDAFSIPDLDSPVEEIALAGEAPSPPVQDDPFAMSPESDSDDVPIDSFDTFSLDNNIASDFGIKSDSPASDEGFASLEDFSLEGIDAMFSKDKGASQPPQQPQRGRQAGKTGSSVGIEEISLTEEDFKKLEDSLDSYPLNLRLACEEIIAEQVIPADQMAELVRMLVRRAPPKECASFAGKILSRSIVIPKGFEKKTGEELEEEQASFVWVFKNRILPIIKISAFVTACSALLFFLGYQFVWRPIAANSLYKKGYELIPQGTYSRARERFDAASSIQRQKKWHYRYAEAFIEKRQYEMARQMYDETLTFFRRDKKAALDYAAMESQILRNFERADRILRAQILDWRVNDREGLLAQGDNFLEWGEIDKSKYEDARKSFAKLIELYGQKDPFMERMLKYFIRTDALAETLALQEHFLGAKKRKIGHETLAELGAYLLDKKEEEPEGVPDPNLTRIANIGKIFEQAIRQDPLYPESWYHLYRYQVRYGTKDQGLPTIRRAVELFDQAEERSAKRKYSHVDAIRRYASQLTEERQFIQAREQLAKGSALYDDAIDRRILKPSGDLGRLYADMGDLDYFFEGRHERALSNYERAVRDGWAPPEIRYRMGYIHYNRGQWRTALERFYEASMDMPLNRRLLFSLANTAAQQGNHQIAQGYYNRLLDVLELERSRFPRLVPAGSVEHAELAERLMRARNNLGVTLEELARQSGRTDYRSRALSLLGESARAWDALTRDPDSMIRSNASNLAVQNTKMILQPSLGFSPEIYREIDKDALEPSAWEELIAKAGIDRIRD